MATSSDDRVTSSKLSEFATALAAKIKAAYYKKPSTGIPKTDLESSVQTSLGLADSALQSHQDISGKADKASGLTAATKCKITYNAQGIVTAGENLTASDVANAGTLTNDTSGNAATATTATDYAATGGIATALDAKQATLTFDQTPSAGSTNPVTSGGILTSLNNVATNALYKNGTNAEAQTIVQVLNAAGELTGSVVENAKFAIAPPSGTAYGWTRWSNLRAKIASYLGITVASTGNTFNGVATGAELSDLAEKAVRLDNAYGLKWNCNLGTDADVFALNLPAADTGKCVLHVKMIASDSWPLEFDIAFQWSGTAWTFIPKLVIRYTTNLNVADKMINVAYNAGQILFKPGYPSSANPDPPYYIACELVGNLNAGSYTQTVVSRTSTTWLSATYLTAFEYNTSCVGSFNSASKGVGTKGSDSIPVWVSATGFVSTADSVDADKVDGYHVVVQSSGTISTDSDVITFLKV